MSYEIEKVWEYSGLTCVVLMMDVGHRCGYVRVPYTHPLYSVNYNEHNQHLNQILINKMWQEEPIKDEHLAVLPLFCWDGRKACPDILFDVHGGITYAGSGERYPIHIPTWIRFKNRSKAWTDYNGWWFGFDCAHDGDGRDLSRIKDPVLKSIYSRHNYGIIRSLDYCINECNNLAEQISKVK